MGDPIPDDPRPDEPAALEPAVPRLVCRKRRCRRLPGRKRLRPVGLPPRAGFICAPPAQHWSTGGAR